MLLRGPGRLTALIVRSGRTRRSVRFRLTALYGVLFLACGAALLAVTYALVAGALDRPPTVVKREVSVAAPTGGAPAVKAPTDGAPTPDADAPAPGNGVPPIPPTPPTAGPDDPAAADSLRQEVQRTVNRQKSAMLHTLLVQSGFALGLMALTSVLLGWVVAGRILRPLRTITSTARDISATSLQRRLALDGPRDELRELGDTFDALLARLEGAFQAQRQFVANASHELRTPLARQRALGQVALADPEPSVASLRTAHERIIAAGEQQERLIEALLTLARGHAGIDVRHPVDLARIVAECVDGCGTNAAKRQVTLRPSLDAAVTSGHRALVERLVANLLDNAIRYNAPGGHVDIGTATRNGRVVVTVANTGTVVPADAVERIMQPFQRLDGTRPARNAHTGDAPGLGLGLSIVAAIASAHDATLTVAARPGGGLAVTVAFPAGATKPS